MLVSCIRSIGQVIEKMNKKKLRIELSNRRLEIDSMNNVINYLHTQIENNNNSYDSLERVINQTRKISDKNQIEKNNLQIINTDLTKINLELSKEKYALKDSFAKLQKINTDLTKINLELSKELYTLKDSFAKLQTLTDNVDFLRELIINKYLRNKTFKIKYYNSHDGTCPEGGSFTSICEIDNKFYLGDISCGGKQIVRPYDISKQSYLNSWKISIKDNLELSYIEFDKVHKGTITYKPIEWRDYTLSDSTYMCSAVINEDQLKIPIGIIELETIRGSDDFMIYYLIGNKTYLFNNKCYNVFNAIILESTRVEIIMTESN
jgi:hypothetical protein